ncbi:MAG: phosphoenolpyruvate synthase, partial [Gammaproteobacteria bacterium]
GVMFTVDTESGFPDIVLVTAAYGLGETVVQGTVDPDEFIVHKPTFAKGYRTVLRRVLGKKQLRRVYSHDGAVTTTHDVPNAQSERDRFCIGDEDVLQLADRAMKIEAHYSAKAGKHMPMDIEWARDAVDGQLYIVQTRPETVTSRHSGDALTEYVLAGTGEALVSGRSVGSKIASGPVRIIRDPAQLAELQPGEVLVADTTTPDWGPVLGRAAAIITNRGGRTCHAAIVARELDIPAVVGAEGATEKLATGEAVTVSCAEGDVGRVYAGAIAFEARKTDVRALGRPATQIMVNLGNPQAAFKTAMIPNDGVGLARLEFIIGEYVKAHPMALVHPDKVTDPAARAALADLTRHHASPAAFFVQMLSEGVGTIAAAFYPRPVVVRLSDFKTNEYASLLGGADFEPTEANPMLGFRGASRYDHPAYADGFALECASLKRVRDEMGLTNVKIMVPFCRRVDEAEKVIAAMARHGLARGNNGLEIYVMCEIPNNVISIDAFARHFDGFSIGSNDLTQLTLGVDRDSDIVAFDFDERDPGMKEMLRLAVEGARRNRRHVGICGQAPSDYPEIAEFLVRLGIDSISLSPDAVAKTWAQVLEVEKTMEEEGAQPESEAARSV